MLDSVWSKFSKEYVLMHKDTPVIKLVFLETFGELVGVGEVYNKEHLPVGTQINGNVDRSLLVNWWRSRCIPHGRESIRSFLDTLHVSCPDELLITSLGLSLSDQYWIKPIGSEISWSSVNFFENDYSEDIGDAIFGLSTKSENNLDSPDCTTDGIMLKRWKIIDGKRYLLKTTTDALHREVYNEVIASILCKALGIPHAKYEILQDKHKVVSACEDFITTATELVPAYYALGQPGDSDNSDLYARYVESCKKLGIDVVPFIDGMIVLDYIIENYDRHYRNFGLIRNADTLEFVGPAPIFDTGSSLRSKDPVEYFADAKHGCKPFRDTFDEQLELVTAFGWIDFGKLYDSLDEISALLTGTMIEKTGLKDAILELLERNIVNLEEYAESRENTSA